MGFGNFKEISNCLFLVTFLHMDFTDRRFLKFISESMMVLNKVSAAAQNFVVSTNRYSLRVLELSNM